MLEITPDVYSVIAVIVLLTLLRFKHTETPCTW